MRNHPPICSQRAYHSAVIDILSRHASVAYFREFSVPSISLSVTLSFSILHLQCHTWQSSSLRTRDGVGCRQHAGRAWARGYTRQWVHEVRETHRMEPPLVFWYDRRQWMHTVERPCTWRSRRDVQRSP